MSVVARFFIILLAVVIGLAVPAGTSILPTSAQPAPAEQPQVTEAPAKAKPAPEPAAPTRPETTPQTSDPASNSSATGPKVVHLTFDDGPNPTYTPQVLAVLREHGVHATFFMLGDNAEANPDLVAQVRAEGHQVASHTWSHPDLTMLSDSQIRSQVERTDAVLGTTSCVRPPYGATSSRVSAVLREGGHTPELWDVDPQDWDRPGTATIVSRVMKQTGPGDVILFHDGGGDRSQTVAALDTVLDRLEAQGYTFETLPGC